MNYRKCNVPACKKWGLCAEELYSRVCIAMLGATRVVISNQKKKGKERSTLRGKKLLVKR